MINLNIAIPFYIFGFITGLIIYYLNTKIYPKIMYRGKK